MSVSNNALVRNVGQLTCGFVTVEMTTKNYPSFEIKIFFCFEEKYDVMSYIYLERFNTENLEAFSLLLLLILTKTVFCIKPVLHGTVRHCTVYSISLAKSQKM